MIWKHTFGETRAQETRNLLDQSITGDEGIVFSSQFLDELLVLVELLQVIRGHGVHAVMLGTVNVVLVTEDAVQRTFGQVPLYSVIGILDRSHTRCSYLGGVQWVA